MYVLWDIDGTLIENTADTAKLFVEALELATGGSLRKRVPDPHGMTEGQLLAAALEVNGYPASLLPVVFEHLDRLGREQHANGFVRRACAGIDGALRSFADHGWTNSLLTGNGTDRSRFKLLAAGIDPDGFDWEHSYFGHSAPTRHHLTAGARDALTGHHAIILGDTPNDGLAADSAGFPFIGVATGVFGVRDLRRTNAILVVPDLDSGLDEVVNAIRGATEG